MGSGDPQIVEKRGKSLLDRRFLWCSCGFDASSPEQRFGLEPSTACDPRNDGISGMCQPGEGHGGRLGARLPGIAVNDLTSHFIADTGRVEIHLD
jgi:hypothetical protein